MIKKKFLYNSTVFGEYFQKNMRRERKSEHPSEIVRVKIQAVRYAVFCVSEGFTEEPYADRGSSPSGYCSLLKAADRVLSKLDIENRTFIHITGDARRLK